MKKYTNKNKVFFAIFIGLISSSFCSCSVNKDLNFDKEVLRGLNSSESAEINNKQKEFFNLLYGTNKARKAGHDYCNQLDSGISKDEIRQRNIAAGLLLIQEKKITAEESAYIDLVNISIQIAAQEVYCPNHRDIEQIPIKERFK